MSTDVETIPTRITERELADHVSEIVDRVVNGERIVIERDGNEIVVLEPVPPPKKIRTWGDLVYFLQHESVFDEELARAVREVRDSQGPARAAEWPD